jgi:hypothetical protein
VVDPNVRRELIATAVERALELVVFAVAAAPDVSIAEILRAIQRSGRGDDFTRRYAFPHA